MLTRIIPRTREAIPAIGLGTWQTFDVASSDKQAWRDCAEVLSLFFAAGGRVIDSSPMYGKAEAAVGALLDETGRRKDAFIATKVWTEGKQRGIAQMRASMRKLRSERIDLMQVHNLVDVETQLATLRAWREQGKVRHIGVTHYALSAFDEIERIMARGGIDFVQIPYSIAVRKAEKRLLPAAAEHGVAVLVMRPFEGGELFGRVRKKSLPPWAGDIGVESWAQFFLKYILGHPAVTCPIPATRNPKHLGDNMKAGLGGLPDARMREQMVRYVEG